MFDKSAWVLSLFCTLLLLNACVPKDRKAHFTVTDNGDGNTGFTLRRAIENLGDEGGEILFSNKIKAINLSSPLRLPANISITGDQGLPVITYTGKGSVFYIDGVKGVSISGIGITQNTGSSELSGDCITVRNGATDIVLNDLNVAACNDGLIDVTTTGFAKMDVSIKNVVFSNHDKVMLVSAPPHDYPKEGIIKCAEPIIKLFVINSKFEGTGQRHPRVSGRVVVELIGSSVTYAPFKREHDYGGTYGIYADKGAKVIVKNSVIQPKNSSVRRKDWSTSGEVCTDIDIQE